MIPRKRPASARLTARYKHYLIRLFFSSIHPKHSRSLMLVDCLSQSRWNTFSSKNNSALADAPLQKIDHFQFSCAISNGAYDNNFVSQELQRSKISMIDWSWQNFQVYITIVSESRNSDLWIRAVRREKILGFWRYLGKIQSRIWDPRTDREVGWGGVGVRILGSLTKSQVSLGLVDLWISTRNSG